MPETQPNPKLHNREHNRENISVHEESHSRNLNTVMAIAIKITIDR